jgi:hypothetical protein
MCRELRNRGDGHLCWAEDHSGQGVSGAHDFDRSKAKRSEPKAVNGKLAEDEGDGDECKKNGDLFQ